MRARGWGMALMLMALASAAGVAGASAASSCCSAFALAVMTGADPPRLLLAQRAIDRAWGPSDDSVYREVRVPQWKSEALAVSLSAAVPGTGQLYAGENSGYVYLLGEAAGWVSRAVFRRKADDRRSGVEHFAGPPADPASSWSADRWAKATGGDPSEIVALYQADRVAYLYALGSDDRYLAGWSGDPGRTRETFQVMRGGEQKMVRRARYAEWGLMLNHVVSAVDALRAARIQNLPLGRDLELRLRSNWRHGGPALAAVVQRRF